MSGCNKYALDANVFIQAHKTYYGFDLCPGFWLALLRQHELKRLCSIDKVRKELVDQGDKLTDWVNDTAPAMFFKGTADKAVSDAFRDLMNWVQSEDYSVQAKSTFAAAADGWLIAYAKINGHVVVTHEAYKPDAKNRVLIPNLCIEFDVEWCNTFEMLRQLKIRFGLKKRKPKA